MTSGHPLRSQDSVPSKSKMTWEIFAVIWEGVTRRS